MPPKFNSSTEPGSDLQSNGSCSDSCVVASIRQMSDKAEFQLLSAKMR